MKSTPLRFFVACCQMFCDYQLLCGSTLGITIYVCFYQWCFNYNSLHLLFALFPNYTVVKYSNVWKIYLHQFFQSIVFSFNFNQPVDFMYLKSFAPFSDYMLNKFSNAVVLSLSHDKVIWTQILSALIKQFWIFLNSTYSPKKNITFCTMLPSNEVSTNHCRAETRPNGARESWKASATNQLWKDIKGGLEVLTSPGSEHWFSAGSLQALHCGFRGAHFATDPVCEIEGERINNRVSTLLVGLRWQEILANKVETCQRDLRKEQRHSVCSPHPIFQGRNVIRPSSTLKWNIFCNYNPFQQFSHDLLCGHGFATFEFRFSEKKKRNIKAEL